MEKKLIFILPIFIILSRQAIAKELASKGARIEASFIIQNKHNALLEHMKNIKQQLEEARINKDKLVQERQIVSNKLRLLKDHYEKQRKKNVKKLSYLVEEIDKLTMILALLDVELNYACLIAKIYPRYTRELDIISLYLGKTISDLTELSSIEYVELRKTVDKAFIIKDKIDAEALILKLIYEIAKLKVNIDYKEKMLPQKIESLKQLESHVMQPLTLKQQSYKQWLQKQITYLHTIVPKMRDRLKVKQSLLQESKAKARAINNELHRNKQKKDGSLIRHLQKKTDTFNLKD